jgi:hypothetical protein
MPLYKVTFISKDDEISECVFIDADTSDEAMEYGVHIAGQIDHEEVIAIVREATEDEVDAYSAGHRDGWEDHVDALVVKERMKEHNGHIKRITDLDTLESVEMFTCPKCQLIKDLDEISGEQTTVGEFDTLWDICKDCVL